MAIESIKWGKGRKDAFILWLDFELTDAIGEHDTLVSQWIKWLDLYRAPVKQPARNIPYEGAPLARDTEILTRAGWKRVDAISIGEIVLTRRDDTTAMEWRPVRALPKVFSEKLYHFKSRAMDLMVTPGHTMIAERQEKKGAVRRIKAKDLWEGTGYVLPHHGTWLGVEHETLWGLPAGDVAEFIGWYLAEGSVAFQQRNPANRHCIRISQSPGNTKKCQRIEEVLTRLKFNWQQFGHDYVIYAGSVPTPLFDLLASQRHSYKKRVPSECFDWSAPLIDRLLMGMILGDGCISHLPKANYPKVDYYTCSRGLADDVQTLSLLMGLHARVLRAAMAGDKGGIVDGGRQIVARRDHYVVSICATPHAKYDRAKHAIVDYNDVAFCVTVDNHAIYARRNGKASWTGNSNFMLPIIATDADQLYAKFLQTIHAADNVWTLSPLNERWITAAKPIQDFLTWLDGSLLKMYNVNKRVLGEMVKLGTGIYKTGWTYEKRNVWTYDQSGKVVKAEKIKGAPFVDHVRLADFVFPHNSYSIDPDAQGGAPWVAERIRVSPDRLKWLAQSTGPYLPNVDKATLDLIIRFEETGSTNYDQAIQRQDYVKASQGAGLDFETEKGPAATSDAVGAPGKIVREIELWEIHARYPTGDGDSQDDVVVWFHRPTRKIVRGVYNHYHHGKRPYDVIRYFPGEGFYGMGVCEQTELFQTSGSDMFNFMWDNVLLVNSRMIVVKAGSNIAPGEPIYPGKIFITDNDVRQDFAQFPMGDVYPSLPAIQEMIMSFKNKRNGVGDIQMGQIESLPGRTPATTMMSLLQEGARRPDLTIKDMRYEGISTVGLRVLQCCQQFMTSPVDVGGKNLLRVAMDVLGSPEGQSAGQMLTIPAEQIENGLGVQITATSASHNKEVEKQNLMGLMQLAGQLTPQFLQLAQVAQQGQGSPIGQVALESARGLTQLYTRLCEQFDIRNTEEVVPQAFGAQTGSPNGVPAQPLYGPVGQPPAPSIDPRLAALVSGIGGGA